MNLLGTLSKVFNSIFGNLPVPMTDVGFCCMWCRESRFLRCFRLKLKISTKPNTGVTLVSMTTKEGIIRRIVIRHISTLLLLLAEEYDKLKPSN